MIGLSRISLGQFKSNWRSLAYAFCRSRNLWKVRSQRLRDENRRLRRELRQTQQEKHSLHERVRQLSHELKQRPTIVVEPTSSWSNLHGHQFSAQMICLCCRLCLLVGAHAVPKVLTCIAETFNLTMQIPSRDAVRNWSCRNGVAILGETQSADDWVWMIDHSVQLGKMFVLVVLGIRQSQIPIGRALYRHDMTPIAVLPTNSRSKDEVNRQLSVLTKKLGMPSAIISDGARELHEGVSKLKNEGFSGVHLDDIKHKIANLLKKRLSNDESWKLFSANLARCTAAIQQTELDHLLPPRKREKGRFMDFDRLIDWATMIRHQLSNASPSERARLDEKFGWINDFASALSQWKQYRHLIGETLSMANEQGVFAGASDVLHERLAQYEVQDERVRQFIEEVESFYRDNEAQLSRLNLTNVRLPCSTEVLESAFGSFKALQRHHNRGTFTSLLAVFACQFDDCTPEKIRHRFARITNKDVKTWLSTSGLTNSTQARRTRAYREARSIETLFCAV